MKYSMLNTDTAEAQQSQQTQGIESVQVNLSYPFLQINFSHKIIKGRQGWG